MVEESKSLADLVNAPVVLNLPGMQEVRVHSNLVYGAPEDPNLRMDVYSPRGDRPAGAGFPIVLLIHGGAGAELRPKDWGMFQSWGRLLAAAGFTAVTFTHRLAPPPNSLLPEAVSDVQSALKFVREHAREWGADADRVCLAVWSAGGPLLTPFLRERPAYLRCVLGFYPLLDMQQYAPGPDPAIRAFLKSFSPISSVEGGSALPPFFIARAGKDAIPLLNDALDRFVTAALAANAPLTLMNHPTGIHGFDNQTADDRSREILQSAIAFLTRHLTSQ